MTDAKNATKRSIRNSAGSRRRARRAQNPPSLMVDVWRHSPIRSEVIRKPERTKKASTPMNPPSMCGIPPWNSMTARTAKARTPSSAGRYERRVCEIALSSSCIDRIPPVTAQSGTAWVRGKSHCRRRAPRAPGVCRSLP